MLLHGAGNQVTNDIEKTKVLNACFTTIFTGKKIGFQKFQVSETMGRVHRKEDVTPSGGESSEGTCKQTTHTQVHGT